MAKRKRLTPANPAYQPDAAKNDIAARPGASALPRAPIADVAGEASSRAALEEVSSAMTRARDEGRLILTLPLSEINLGYLVRDRVAVEDADMEALKASLLARGQQTPIEVADLGNGRFGLISGWRRCQALLALAKETDDPQSARVLALLRKPAEMSDAYLAMVEENEIRANLSFFERARIAAKAVEQGVFETDKQALLELFRSASRSKRSKVRSFLSVVKALDGHLTQPQAIGERLGLQLSKRLDADPEFADGLRRDLAAVPNPTAEAEAAILNGALTVKAESTKPQKAPDWRDHKVRPGLTLRDYQGKDYVEIRGAGMNADLRIRLLQWLSEQS